MKCNCMHDKKAHNLSESYCNRCYDLELSKPHHKFIEYRGKTKTCPNCGQVKKEADFYGYPKHMNRICMTCFDKPNRNLLSIDSMNKKGLDVFTEDGVYKVSKRQDDFNLYD